MTPLDRPPIAGEFQDAAEHNAIHRKRPGTPPPFSLRLTTEEKAALKRAVGTMPLGAYIRSKLLGEAARQRVTHRSPVKDDLALAQLLGELGKAKLSNNLNQLAKAANTGSLAVTPETEKAIQDACRDVQWMRARLISKPDAVGEDAAVVRLKFVDDSRGRIALIVEQLVPDKRVEIPRSVIWKNIFVNLF